MINAGIAFLDSYGRARFNNLTGVWSFIKVKVTYPLGQTIYNNPIEVGDIITENIGNIWKVVDTRVTGVVDNVFELSITQMNATPHPNVAPEFLLTTMGSVATPIKGITSAFWNAKIVDAQVFRRVQSFNIEQGHFLNQYDFKTINGMSLVGVGDIKVLSQVTKEDIGLGLVQNVDQTNASNITSGLLHDDRIPENILRGNREVFAGLGLSGGGFIKDNITLNLSTPLTITGTSENRVFEESHSHALFISKNDIGLENVDNTSDLEKPISLLQQQELNKKQDLLVSKVNIATINNESLLRSGNFFIPIFLENGDYINLRARATTKEDVGLGDIQNVDTTNADNIISGTLDDNRLSENVVFRNRKINTLGGLIGGGDLSTDLNLALGTPSTITISTGNSLTEDSHTHNLELSKGDIGLGLVDNTRDINKPISVPVQEALDKKQDLLVSGENFKTINLQSLLGTGNITISKVELGLGNVDNTSDINKPISSATQVALNSKQNTLIPGNNINISGNTIHAIVSQVNYVTGIGLRTVPSSDGSTKIFSLDMDFINNLLSEIEGEIYTAGNGLQLINNVFSINPTTKLGTINGTSFVLGQNITIPVGSNYTAGTGISISSSNVISCTVSGGITYTAAAGLNLTSGAFSIRSDSNGHGRRWASHDNPSGGSDGDMWYTYE